MTAPNATPSVVRVAAPSRLHFGLLAFGGVNRPAFGGVGVMIDRPGIRLTMRRSARFEVVGPLKDRAGQFAERFLAQCSSTRSCRCRIDVVESSREHIGLGTGTQLGLSVCAGLATLFGQPMATVEELAAAAGRGRRSSIGSHGFWQGGLLYEETKRGTELAPLQARAELPAAWRWLLIRPRTETGLYGDDERRAFARLDPVPAETTAALRSEINDRMLPAARQPDFEAFSHSVYRYGVAAGNCFAAVQGGPFATPWLAEIVQAVRDLGVPGVGQSSWGPTVFAIIPDDALARRIRDQLTARPRGDQLEFDIAPTNNAGVRIDTEP